MKTLQPPLQNATLIVSSRTVPSHLPHVRSFGLCGQAKQIMDDVPDEFLCQNKTWIVYAPHVFCSNVCRQDELMLVKIPGVVTVYYTQNGKVFTVY